MSGENINVYGAQLTLESNGGAITSGTLGKATNAYDLSANGFYPDAVFALVVSFATAPTENSVLSLYAQPLLIDGTNNTQQPEASRPTRVIGNFVVNDVNTLQAIEMVAYDLPLNAYYWLYNNATGQQVSAGWKLFIKPRTVKVAP